MSELIYDIENKTSLTGIARDTGTNYRESADMRATEVEEHRNQVLRSIGNAFSSLRNELAEYMCASGGTQADNTQIGDWQDIEVCLGMPTNYDLATKEAVSSAMHRYIVDMTLYDWFNIFSKDDAAAYLKMASVDIQQIRRSINKRSRPQRRPLCNCCCNKDNSI